MTSAEKAAQTASILAKGAENAKAAGDMDAHVELLAYALQYLQLAKSLEAMDKAIGLLEQKGIAA